MKGVIQPNHIPMNNFVLQVIGLPDIVFTEVGDISEIIDKVDLPDRTRASGGRSGFQVHAEKRDSLSL